MILTLASFTFIVKGEKAKVVFWDDKIRVTVGKKSRVFQNIKRQYGGRPYWPCVSHCKCLIERVADKPATTAHSRQRRAAVEPKKLGVFRP